MHDRRAPHWPHRKAAPVDPATLTPKAVAQTLAELAASCPRLSVETIGTSYAGRPICAARIGRGPQTVVAWSQMHGDEPTHTAVLLDLLAWLANAPADDAAATAILQQLTVVLAPMLNPDGAVAGTRENAQGIDVNRDARRLQSPEGRILRELVQRERPAFAFNLHNQNARSTVGRSKLPSVVALMTPPVDPADSQSPHTQRARQVAVTFCEMVEPHCPGMVSRYSASYMPRAFGEWVQGSGTATVLVEAGGMPADTSFDMVALHAVGLARTLAAIATDDYQQRDPARYEALPLDGEITRFDMLVPGTTVADHCGGSFFADLGINFASGRRLSTGPLAAGVITEIGDLAVTTGKVTVDGTDLVCRPGAWAFDPHMTPATLPAVERTAEWLPAGVTTVVGVVDPLAADQLAALESLASQPGTAINLAFLVAMPADGDRRDDRWLSVMTACRCGAAGVVGSATDAETTAICQRLKLPFVAHEELGRQPSPAGVDALDPVAAGLSTLGGVLRGRVAKGAIADLVLVRRNGGTEVVDHVLVGGVLSYSHGALTGHSAGCLLACQ